MREYRTIPISLYSVLISLAIHLALYILFSLELIKFKQHEPEPPKTLQIRRIETPKTVGEKHGLKDFMIPLDKGTNPEAEKVNPKANAPRTSSQSRPSPQQPMSLDALKTENIKVDDIKPLKKDQMEVASSKNTPSNFKVTTTEANGQTVQRQEMQREKQREQSQILREFSKSQASAEAIAGKGFALDFIPPEGVSEDELNTMEKIFFSFQRRTFMTYVGSFIKSFETIGRQKPNLKNALQTESHHLAARVTFDEAGNIQLIKIIKSVPNDDVHLLFEETLKGMISLPNPPKDMIDSDGTFTIYFQLKIN